MSERRSSRVNKGQHSKRELDQDFEYEIEVSHKKVKTDDAEYEDKNDEDTRDDEIVRCIPCGTNKDNYDEATDTGGTFIQCDECNTWQHAKCMGFRSNKSIPEHYKCNVCDPELLARNAKVKSPVKKPEVKAAPAVVEPAPLYGIASLNAVLKTDHRLSTSKAFFNYFKKSFHNDKSEQENEKVAGEWALKVEEIIFKTYPDNKKYIEGGRRILFLLKKHFMADIINGTLTFEELVKKTPKEINRDIEKVEEKVRGNIKNIILTVNEPSDIVRRTHKGDIIREDENNHEYEFDQNITTRSVDHRRFSKDDEETQKTISLEQELRKSSYNNMNPRIDTGDDEEPAKDSNGHVEPEKTENKSSESSDLEHIHEAVSEDDLYPILTGESKPTTSKDKSSNKVWTGQITFPDFASFSANAEFYSSSDYDEFSSAHELSVRTAICSDIFTNKSYQIEGRLDRQKADAYLNKITSTRNLYLVEIKPNKEDEEEFQKLYKYLLIKGKVGVLSDKPWFVKDAYLIPVDFRDEQLPYYLQSQKMDLRIGLFALYSVKKDYEPRGQNGRVPEKAHTSNPNPSNELSQIMSQLGA